MMTTSIFTFLTTFLSISSCQSYEPLLKEITTLYPPNAYLDDINSIAIDEDNNIYATNTASGTIDIITYNSLLNADSSETDQELIITRSIDIQLQASPYFALDYITDIVYTSRGYIVATLIPLNYAKLTGWLVFIDPSTQYIENFIPLKYCYSPKHIQSTSDGNKLIIACEGLADGDIADPAGSISVINIESDDATQWKIYNVGFTDYDDCDEDLYSSTMKHLPNGIYLPKPEELFSINVEPEYVTIDDNDRYAYISLQENNGIAIFDIFKLEIVEIYSFGAHDFGYTGLDASDKDNGINIMTYNNVYGLRQPDGIAFYKAKGGKKYILTANEGNAKYYDTLRVNTVELDATAFPNGDVLKKDDNLGRLQILNAGEEYGLNENGEFEKLYAFGSRDWAAWEIEGPLDDDCPCDYPYALREVFSSYDDFEQITAYELGIDGFNTDFFSPSFDTRSDGKGPEPEAITVGECSNGDVYVFIGLERVGGIMVYDITDLEDGEVYYVEYLNTRDFTVEYEDDTRPPQEAGDVEPEELIFIQDTDDSDGQALLIVGYKTSASLGVYSFDCGCHRNYKKDNKPPQILPSKGTADECIDQGPCINVDIRPIIIGESENDGIILDDEEGKEMYVVCMSFDIHNPYCTKDDEYFTYGVEAGEEYLDDKLSEWYMGEQRCKIAECNSFVRFCIMDGDGCANSEPLSTTIDNVDFITCQKTVLESCRWKIPTPICTVVEEDGDSDGETTTAAPRITTTTSVTADDGSGDGYFNNEVIYKPDDPNYMQVTEAKEDYASTCDEQGGCLKISVSEYETNGNEEYEVCIYWNGNLDGCNKKQEVPFFKAAIGTTDGDKTYRWESGLNNQLCKVVECGEDASFGIKDESCAYSIDFGGIIDDIDGVTCSGSDGGYGVTDSCQWNIPVPTCKLRIVGDTDSSTDDEGEGGEGNNEKETRSDFDVIINRGGHFYESTMFYILLAVFICTFIAIITCVYKHSKQNRASIDIGDNINDDEEPSEFAE